MAEGFAQVTELVGDVQKATEEALRLAGNAIGQAGRLEVLALAVQLFGADRKFSGARGSRTAGGRATASYLAFPDRVEVYPSGDPFYIFLKGRGRSNISPKGAKRGKRRAALKTPYGAFRRVHGGRMAPRPPSILDPAERRTAEKATQIIADTIINAVRAGG